MPKYAKPIATEKRGRGRPLKYPRDRYGEVLKLRLKGMSLGKIAEEMLIPKSSVYRMLRRMGFS
jgi:hypothetical protein